MNLIWGGMIVISILLAILSGNLEELVKTLFESAESTITTMINFTGIVCMWSGFIKIAEKSGMIEKISIKIMPIVKKVIPNLPDDKEVSGHIAMNITANMLGLRKCGNTNGIKSNDEFAKV